MFHDGYWSGGSKNSFTKEEIDGFIDERLRTMYSILPNTIPDLQQAVGGGGGSGGSTITMADVQTMLDTTYGINVIESHHTNKLLDTHASANRSSYRLEQILKQCAPRTYFYYLPVEIGGGDMVTDEPAVVAATTTTTTTNEEVATAATTRNPGEAPFFMCIPSHLNALVIFDAGGAVTGSACTYTIPVEVVVPYILDVLMGPTSYTTSVEIHLNNRCPGNTVQVIASPTFVTVGTKSYAFELRKKMNAYDTIYSGGFGIVRFMYENRIINGTQETIPVALIGDFTA